MPKTPQSYRIQEPVRSEIIALMADLDLVFVGKRFVLYPQQTCRLLREYSPLPKVHNKSVKKGISVAVFMNRNHHYKNFKNVYPSDYNYKNFSFDWD